METRKDKPNVPPEELNPEKEGTIMTPTQERFVVLEKRKDEYKQWLQELQEATQAVADEIGGVNKYFQDEESGIVYRMIKPTGRYVHYEEWSYLRTKREGETKGTLSIKEAKEQGFVIEGL